MSEGAGESALSVVYVIGTYPRLTTTFIDREVAVLRRRGVHVHVVSLRHPDGPLSDDQSTAGVTYALPVSPLALLQSHARRFVSAPGAYLRTLWRLVAAPHPSVRARAKTVGHFGLAVRVADLVAAARPVDHVHAHFVDRAALVGLVVGQLLDIPYSATAHANDIYVSPVLLDEKVAAAKFVATCTQANADHLARVVSHPERIRRLYHGLDVSDYDAPDRARSDEPILVAVGQLKEKKGFVHLVEACRRLTADGHRFRCEIVGEGPQRSDLEARIAAAGLGDRVVLRGALSHDEVKALYARADVFVLPAVVSADGDRDGIPNVILEAMASGLPVVSTEHSGIPEAVDHGTSGLLTPPGDATALTDALRELIGDPDLRRHLGAMGRKQVADTFDAEANVGRLLEELLA